MLLARLIHWLRLPGLVSEGEYNYGGVFLSVVTSSNYTSLTVNDVTFYFNRESGKYDGWGRNA